jgi:hypothetical protein
MSDARCQNKVLQPIDSTPRPSCSLMKDRSSNVGLSESIAEVLDNGVLTITPVVSTVETGGRMLQISTPTDMAEREEPDYVQIATPLLTTAVSESLQSIRALPASSFFIRAVIPGRKIAWGVIK